MNEPKACAACLRRGWLLAHLAPYIEKATAGGHAKGISELLCLDSHDLAQAAAPEVAAHVIAQVDAIPDERLQAELAAAECWGCCKHDPGFPGGLRGARDAPRALIGRGDPGLLARLAPEHSVSIVGARRASTYGREAARELGRGLAEAGLLVISGLAFGIDASAHRGALEGGSTVAVLGCGADVAYPATHRSLWRAIAEGGLVLSELPPGAGVWRWTSLARNRIVAALSGMTVVVEAAERAGSLVTANFAADLGREVGAVPGPVNSRLSAGPNNLLAEGACLIRDTQDVLDAMLGPGARRIERSGPPLSPLQREVLKALEDAAGTCREIATDTHHSGDEVAAALADLDSLGYARRSLVPVYAPTGVQPSPAA